MQWRATTYATDAEHGENNPAETYAVDHSTTTETIYLLGDGSLKARFQAAQDFCGYAKVTTLSPQVYIARITPKPYPLTNQLGDNFEWCLDVTNAAPYGVPIGDPATTATNAKAARMVLHYQSVPFRVLPDNQVVAPSGPLASFPDEGWYLANKGLESTRYISRQRSDGGSFITSARTGTLGYQTPQTTNGFIQLLQPLAVNQPTTDLVYIWHYVPVAGVPWKAIDAAEGRVNNATFDGRVAGTLLFKSASQRIYNSPLGDRVCDMHYAMKFVANATRTDQKRMPGGTIITPKGTQLGWNATLGMDLADQGQVDWYPCFANNNGVAGNPPYDSAPFDALFRPDQGS
jgi:hypothetical protein